MCVVSLFTVLSLSVSVPRPKPKGPSRRAEPWQLRQEDSDGVWNELAYFKRLARKLDVEK